MNISYIMVSLLLVGGPLARASKSVSIWLSPGVPASTQDGTVSNPFQVSSAADIQQKLDSLDRTARSRPIAHFFPGLYNADETIDLRTRITIAGAGVKSTIFRKAEQSKNPYGIFQNANFGGGEQIEIRDLAIDCNRRSQIGIAIYGDNNTVRNVHIYNHVNPKLSDGTYAEAFAILLSNRVDPTSKGWVNSSGGLVENCLVTGFGGHNGGGICIAGGEDPSIATGTVRNCRVIGSENPLVPEGTSDFRWGVGATVTEGCTTENLSAGTYVEGDTGRTVIRNNKYLNCSFAGVMISLRVTSSANSIEIRNNEINLKDGGYGIFAVNNFKLNGTLRHLVVENNRITSRNRVGTADWCNIFNVPSFVLKNNTYDATMLGRVRGSQGYVAENKSSDGAWSIRKARISSAKESVTNQLEALKVEMPRRKRQSARQ